MTEPTSQPSINEAIDTQARLIAMLQKDWCDRRDLTPEEIQVCFDALLSATQAWEILINRWAIAETRWEKMRSSHQKLSVSIPDATKDFHKLQEQVNRGRRSDDRP